jgi:hypothetical protein
MPLRKPKKSAKREPDDVVSPDGGKLETELDGDGDDQVDDEVLEREAQKKIAHEKKLKKERNDRYRQKQPPKRETARERASAAAEADVDDALKDPELRKVFEEFSGKIGSADDLAAFYSLVTAPLGIFVHEEFQLFNPETGEPTAECKQLARGTWPCMRKYAGPWLAWVRTHSPEVLAIATVIFFVSKKLPITIQLVNDPSQLRINRMRVAAAEAAAAATGPTAASRHPPRQEGAAAAAQVVEMAREKPDPQKQEAA